MISFIVAMDRNNVIGRGQDNKMPWHLPNDLRHFKEKTTGHTVVMGRKTFQSLGRVLPNRKHIVLTRSSSALPEEVEVIHDIQTMIDMMSKKEEEIFVIGGGDIFKQILPYADRLYVTVIEETFEGDIYFPSISTDDWRETSKEKGIKDEKNPYDYFFIQYDRK